MNDLEKYLEELVSFASYDGRPTDKNNCITHVEKFFISHGLIINHRTENETAAMVASSSGSNSPKVLLQAHLDVVPASDEMFIMKNQGSKLIGRGVFDMKFAAACYMKLVEDLTDDIKHYDLGIMLTTDEEIGGENGVGWLLDQGYSADVCILPDAGDNWQIETSANGVWIAKVISNGQAAHGSRPWDGSNAITSLTDCLKTIRDTFDDPDPEKSSLTISKIEGGEAMNQVPDYACATLDMRFVTSEDYQLKRIEIEKIVKHAGLGLETYAHVPNTTTDCQQPLIKRFIEVAEQVRSKPVGRTRSFGSSDAHFFAKHDIPTILIRPDGGGAHSDTEWVDKASLNEFYDVLKAYVTEVAKTS